MTSDNIAEYVGENSQFTEKPVTEYPPVIQDNTVTTKDYLYSNNIDTDLLVVWICPYISRHLLSLNPLQARCRRYSRGER